MKENVKDDIQKHVNVLQSFINKNKRQNGKQKRRKYILYQL